ncbi:TPA: phytanoyl-CoA dioxygenase family protein [Klebsiella quasipneumoniae subsp. similipneumoniae]|nr:phytanoyl-CoA dioxygenase family protein [Klebsiella quasipneumoniae subsp. similipneumoniae]
MIAQWQIEQFHQQGYLVVEGVLSAADIATLQSDFDGWVEESRRHATAWGETLDGRSRFDIERDHAPDHPSLRRVASPTEISEAYRHTALNSRMATIAAQLIGGNGTRFHHSKINSKQPQACFGPAGSVCFMHTRLLHASSPNETALPRTLFISVYAAEDALPFGENPLPSRHAGQLVAGEESGLVRSTNNQLRLPQKPRGASFFVQQAGADRASM